MSLTRRELLLGAASAPLACVSATEVPVLQQPLATNTDAVDRFFDPTRWPDLGVPGHRGHMMLIGQTGAGKSVPPLPALAAGSKA